jgi:hypothetical protein
MATLYWVGGTGYWSDVANWSLSSGGGTATTSNPATVTSIANNIIGRGTSYVNLVTASTNSGNVALPIPFNVTFLGTTYTTGQVFVGSNSFITFGGGSSGVPTSPVTPAFPKIMITAADNSYQFVSYEILGTSPNRTFRVRFEGTNGVTGVVNSPTMVWEATFYEANPAQIDIQIGANNQGNTLGLSGVYSAAAALIPFTTNANVGYRVTTVAPGATIILPTSVDDVVFDTNSSGGAAYTVTLDASTNRTVTISATAGAPITLAGIGTWNIYGSMLFPAANIVRTWTGALNFLATTVGYLVTPNGTTFTQNITFNGAGGWTLGSALTTTGTLTFTAGTFATGNFAISAASISSNNTNVRSISLGSSVITLSSGGAAWTFTTITNLTFNAGTSQIDLNGQSITFNGGGLTYATVNFNQAAALSTHILNGINTFANLSFDIFTGIGTNVVQFGADQTVTGTLTATGAAANRILFLSSTVVGTVRTITVAAHSAFSYVNFRDITAQGAVIPWSGTRLGNLGNNTNITFDAPKTVYWSLLAGGAWSAVAWATTSGGVPNAANQPTPQDTVIFDNAGLTTGNTISLDTNYQIGNISFGLRNTAMTFAAGANTVTAIGNITLSSAVTYTGTGAWTLYTNAGTQTITSNGGIPSWPITINPINNGIVQLADALTMSNALTFTTGTLNLNNNNLTVRTFSSSNANTRTLAVGTAQINLSGTNATIWNMGTITGLTITGTLIINATTSGTAGQTRTITLGALTGLLAPSVNISAGVDTVSVSGNVNNLVFTAFTGGISLGAGGTMNIYGNLTLSAGVGAVSGNSTLTFIGTSGSNTLTTAGRTINGNITFNGLGSTWTLVDALSMGSGNTLILTAGSLVANNQNVSTGSFSSTGAAARSLSMGNGTWNIAGSWTLSGTNLTFNSGLSTINMSSDTAKNFAGFNQTYYNVVQTGLGNITLTGNNVFNSLSNTDQPSNITFTGGSVNTFTNFTVSGNALDPIGLLSSNTTNFTLVKAGGGTVQVSGLSINYSTASPLSTWYATGSFDLGNNIGWNFVYPTLVSRLTSTGTYLLNVNGFIKFDEVTRTGIHLTPTAFYASQFDEVTDIPVAMRQLSTGVVQVAGYFDETQGLT